MTKAILFFDIETTGIKNADLLEWAAVLTDKNFKVLESINVILDAPASKPRCISYKDVEHMAFYPGMQIDPMFEWKHAAWDNDKMDVFKVHTDNGLRNECDIRH